MRDLIILGTGPHAQEMADIIGLINQAQPCWNLLGALAASTQVELVGCMLDNLAGHVHVEAGSYLSTNI